MRRIASYLFSIVVIGLMGGAVVGFTLALILLILGLVLAAVLGVQINTTPDPDYLNMYYAIFTGLGAALLAPICALLESDHWRQRMTIDTETPEDCLSCDDYRKRWRAASEGLRDLCNSVLRIGFDCTLDQVRKQAERTLTKEDKKEER